MSLLTVLPFTGADVELAKRLLEWIEELGGCGGRKLLLVADCKVPKLTCLNVMLAARHSYEESEVIYTPHPLPDERWPVGPNWMFETALCHPLTSQGPWLWLEPDCVPMRRGWMEEIEQAHALSHQPFWGQVIVTRPEQGLPRAMLSGVAVYPADAKERLLKTVQLTHYSHAFDVATALITIPHTQHTRLIYNFIGERGLPPTFVKERDERSPRNAMTLEMIPKQTALFHRCKDGTVIELLKERLAQPAAA